MLLTLDPDLRICFACLLGQVLADGGLLEKEITNVQLMGSDEKIDWKRNSDALTITLPKTLPDTLVVGFSIKLKP